MKRMRALLLFGLALPMVALFVSWRLVPRDRPVSLWSYGYRDLSPAVMEAMHRFAVSSDTTQAYDLTLALADSRERAAALGAVRNGVVVRADSGIGAVTTEAIRNVALAELAALGAPEPRHAIGVVVMLDTRNVYPQFTRAVVLPATPDQPCTIVMRISFRHIQLRGVGNSDRLLGTCGFYAVYGYPGDGMREWLVRTRTAAAGFLQRPASHGDGIIRDPAEATAAGRAPDLAACRAGRLDGCERLFLEPRTSVPEWESTWREIAIVPDDGRTQITQPGQFRSSRTSVSAGLLASIADDLGPERFARLWVADGDMKQAFESAAGRSLGSWIQGRVATAVLVYRAGPGVGAVQWLSLFVVLGIALGAGYRFSRPTLTN
jgi:hypothetical protein